MRKLLLFFIFCAVNISAQTLQFQTIFQDEIYIRAIEIWKDKVYYSGNNSKFGYVGLNNPMDRKQIKLSDKNLQFRTLAQDRKYFYTINVESPANFFRINKRKLKFDVVHQDTAKKAFYDAIIFNKKKFYTFSDPSDDKKLKFLQFDYDGDQFNSKLYNKFDMGKSESAFAGSNTNIAAYKNWVWIATKARILRLNLDTDVIEPFLTGIDWGYSKGIFSIDFIDDKFGVAVGGNYMNPEDNEDNIATTNNGGETWEKQASGKNGGYKSCVSIRPNSKGKEMVSVGSKNIEYSGDYGKTWTTISKEESLFVCKWIDENTLVFAGKNRIMKAKFSN